MSYRKLFKTAFILSLLWAIGSFYSQFANSEVRENKTTIVITTPEEDAKGGLELSRNTHILNDKEAVMILSGGLSAIDTELFWLDMQYLLKKTEIRTIHYYINSGGGSVFAGLGLADLIERAKQQGFTIIGYGTGIIASATVPIFAVCSERIAMPGTLFMVHQAKMFKFLAEENADDIRAQNELMIIIRDRYVEKLAANTNISREKWVEMEQRTTWFTAEQAKEFGLVDRIE
jgi:ATP-dependent Clp protease, protease subunit